MPLEPHPASLSCVPYPCIMEGIAMEAIHTSHRGARSMANEDPDARRRIWLDANLAGLFQPRPPSPIWFPGSISYTAPIAASVPPPVPRRPWSSTRRQGCNGTWSNGVAAADSAVRCGRQGAICMEPVPGYRQPPRGLLSALAHLGPNYLRNAWSVWRKYR